MQYDWIIDTLWVKPTEGSLTDVVITAAWRCTGQLESNGKTYSASVYSTCSFAPPDPSSFIQYDSLTLDEVLNWVYASGVDKQVTEEAVAQQIENQINPPVIMPPLPWSNTGNQS
jgi:hypothetical protein